MRARHVPFVGLALVLGTFFSYIIYGDIQDIHQVDHQVQVNQKLLNKPIPTITPFVWRFVPTTTVPAPTITTTVPPTTTTEPPRVTVVTQPPQISNAATVGGVWQCVREAESGSIQAHTWNYAINTGNGYYGAYQFEQSTWDSTMNRLHDTTYLHVLPSSAPPSVQDAAAINLQAVSGWSQWGARTRELCNLYP